MLHTTQIGVGFFERFYAGSPIATSFHAVSTAYDRTNSEACSRSAALQARNSVVVEFRCFR